MSYKRYQVFVSSTFEDLQEERQIVTHALLELNCIPVGMELFPAADEDQWSLIKRVIDESDYYMLILGGRYGSISPDGISYTQLEYEYALGAGIPIISFVHNDPGSLPFSKSEPTAAGRKKLARFRKLVQKKMVKFWTRPDELGAVVSRSITHLIANRPAKGWVRATDVGFSSEAPFSEINDLRAKIRELELALVQSGIDLPANLKESFKEIAPATEARQALNWLQMQLGQTNGQYVVSKTSLENRKIATLLYTRSVQKIIGTAFFEDPAIYGLGDFAWNVSDDAEFVRLTIRSLCPHQSEEEVQQRLQSFPCNARLVVIPDGLDIAKIGGIYCKMRDESYLAFIVLNNPGNSGDNSGVVCSEHIAAELFNYFDSWDEEII